MSAKRLKTVRVTIRFDPVFKAALDAAAEADFRSVASLIEKAMTDYLKKEGYLTVSATRRNDQPPETMLDAVAGLTEQTAKRALVKEAAPPALSPHACVEQQPRSQSPTEKPPAINRLADLLLGVRQIEPDPKADK